VGWADTDTETDTHGERITDRYIGAGYRWEVAWDWFGRTIA
jgi:hypothetical protein